MEKLAFTQENVDAKIAEIKSLNEDERKVISDAIKLDLRAWLLQNFEFDDAYTKRLAL